jgi:hypothetical protein
VSRYRFVVATEPDQFEEIHRLNYRTFAEEIPQHRRNPERRLVDRFHAENTYVVCELDGRIVGMICVRDRRPFSVDEKIGPFEEHLPRDVPRPGRPCEVRLLAIEPAHRRGLVILGLFRRILEIGLERGYDFVLMSGRVANLRMYRALGFRPFGPLTGTPEAPYQPMFATSRMFALAQGSGALTAALPAMMARALRGSPGPDAPA